MNKVLKTEVYDPTSDEPFKNPLEALSKVGEIGKDDKEEKTESFSERKARYDKERAAKKAAEAEKPVLPKRLRRRPQPLRRPPLLPASGQDPTDRSTKPEEPGELRRLRSRPPSLSRPQKPKPSPDELYGTKPPPATRPTVSESRRRFQERCEAYGQDRCREGCRTLCRGEEGRTASRRTGRQPPAAAECQQEREGSKPCPSDRHECPYSITWASSACAWCASSLALPSPVVVFYMATPISQFLLQPISPYLPEGTDGLLAGTIVLDPFEAFATRFKISIWTSVVACSPVILWQILAFFLPALKPSERKWFVPTFAAAVSLFIFGTIFCYLIILDPAFQWLTDQAAGLGEVVPRASTYIDMIIKFELGFGFAFELPLIVFYLVIFDIVPYKKLRGSWRTVYVVLMVVSAMATPDASPITMLLMFAALLVLYEGSLLIARVVLRNRIKKQNEELDAEEAEERAAELGIKKAKKSK